MIRGSLTLLLLLGAVPAAEAATEKQLGGGPQPVAAPTAGPSVTIDVKDAEAVEILKSLQKQCGVRNLMIDPGVKGKGTFYFHEVPCRQAWSVVLRSLGLDAAHYGSSVVTVGANRHR